MLLTVLHSMRLRFHVDGDFKKKNRIRKNQCTCGHDLRKIITKNGDDNARVGKLVAV